MLELLDNVPNGVTGVCATGTVTTDDYERVFNPLMEAAHREGRRVRLLYEVPAEFKGFTAGAGLEDMRMGMKYLRLFERCAVVTDVGWLREATRLFGALMPCPVKVFPNAERAQAIDWVAAPVLSTVQHRLLPDIGVLVIEPSQPLGAEDFERDRHLRFIREHHRRVSRIGVAEDGVLADAGPTLANAFVEAELKHFAYDRLDEAIRWAAAAPQRPVA